MLNQQTAQHRRAPAEDSPCSIAPLERSRKSPTGHSRNREAGSLSRRSIMAACSQSTTITVAIFAAPESMGFHDSEVMECRALRSRRHLNFWHLRCAISKNGYAVVHTGSHHGAGWALYRGASECGTTQDGKDARGGGGRSWLVAAAGNSGSWRLGRGCLRDIVRDYVIEHLADDQLGAVSASTARNGRSRRSIASSPTKVSRRPGAPPAKP